MRNGDSVLMGADSLGTDGLSLEREVRRDDKIFRAGPNDEYVIGYSTSYRGGQILRYHVAWPEFPDDIESDEDVLRFFVTSIIPRVQDAIESNWRNRKEDDGIDFIMAVGKNFVRISNDLQVAMLHDYVSIGSGSPYAMGAMEVLYNSLERFHLEGPRNIILRALETAEKHNAGVAGPFVLLST